ncbi:hypothetical protein A9Q99_23230 [Gammaproteobacteria bacterium 45_16_T64]|nr:hypothetical protein A9Q99_23230 [Gammaproteobacteria bacterium 45_16_T64]
MTRVDFYILPDHYPQSPLTYASRLIDKVYRMGHGIYVHLENAQDAQYLDEQLWQLSPESFIPHEIVSDTTTDVAVLLGHDGEPAHHGNVMINLSGNVPNFFSRFERVAEIVPGNKEMRTKSRENFRFYKERGYPLHTHNIQIPR